jgi:tetratricopeptide (TPR) repeat protein
MARVVSAQGSVQIKKAAEKNWGDVRLDEVLCPGDMLRVQENSRAALLLRNEAVVRLDQNTAVTLSEDKNTERLNFDILSGIALILSGFPFNLQILTPFVNANIEGTELLVHVDNSGTTFIVYEGTVRAENDLGGVVIHEGESACAGAGAAPVLKTVVRPRDAVHWALYYPPIPDRDLEGLTRGAAPWRQAVRHSIESHRRGDLARAFAHLKGIPSEIDDPAFHSYLATLHLAVGRVEEASGDLARALLLRPDDGYALSLQSIIALAQNRRDEALQIARRAVEASPSAAAPLVALSYAEQAMFDLEGALSSVEKAAEADPEDGLVRARLAELWLSKGDLDHALEAAREAVARNPGLARTRTVLGYAYLTQIRIDESKKAFRKAIGLDQADPLPRLGLGLALIREGDLKAGRREIEIAVMLDPDNALIRSNLGKAYFEDKRDRKSAAELSKAKELDPHDPTPWLYDAIRKQTVNRPVEALEDLHKSIALNDNRAVYRSRLLLDEDLAARSASLGRIYSDLGFQQAALTEGWKSLNIDPANYSAHRFLADSYLALPRHEVARISELLQSQLLQPVNIAPVQPQFKEGHLAVIEQAGLLNPSFNEFTSLFQRNRLALQASGLAGDHDTVGDELIHSGLQGRWSYSVGQFHFQSDGFRENNDRRIDVYDLFTQVSLSPKTSVQAELRYMDLDGGDLGLRFDPGDVLRDFRQERQTGSVRLGLRHAFTPHSNTIASFIYEDADTETHGFLSPLRFTTDTQNKGYMTEVQHLLRYDHFSLIGGAGHFSSDREDLSRQFISLPEGSPVPLMPEKDEPNIRHTNLYIYSLIHYPQDVTWTLGGSADFFHEEDSDLGRDQFNPKLGMTWHPFPETTLRAAWLRTLQRALISSQTIEPTQVAGFNQFFDDPQGTEAWRYGVGIDQKLLSTLSGGLEWSRRDLQVVREDAGFVDRNEQLVRAYLYWAAHHRLAIGLEYQYERFESDPRAPGVTFTIESDTHRIPLGISFFHPSGFLSRLKTTYVYQDGRFRTQGTNHIIQGHEQFMVLDVSVGYRLPGRLGIITIEGRNLLDEEVRFQDTDPANPSIAPERSVLLRFSLSF